MPVSIDVVAHRGSSEDVPEHTFAAYVKAVDDGADALECDVRLTRDGHLVCVHDRRVDRTSSGRGPVSTLELAELHELDFGSWRGRGDDFEEPEEVDHDRSRVLTLDRLLGLVADHRGRLELAIETKHPTRYAGLVEERLVETLERYGFAHPPLGTVSPVRVMSFSWLALRRVRQLAPSLRTVYLMERVPLRFRDGSLPVGVWAAGPGLAVVRAHPSYVARVHARGHPVHVWTVDRLRDVTLCRDLGVDAIITNRPARVLAHLGRAPLSSTLPSPAPVGTSVPAFPPRSARA